MKKQVLFLATALFFISQMIQAGDKRTDEEIVRSIADLVIENTSRTVYDRKTKEEYTSVEGLDYNPNMRIKSKYNHWKYSNGVIHLGMLELSDYLGEEKYREYPEKNYEFFFGIADYFEQLYENNVRTYEYLGYYRMGKLDDCGAHGAALIEVYDHEQKKIYKDYIEKAGNYILNEEYRLTDGTLARPDPHDPTLWLDDLYMSVPFLARMGEFSGNDAYYDFAAKQVIQFTKYLYDPETELYYHCYYGDVKRNGVAHWGRANGWSMMAQVNLLDFLPEDHPQRDTLVSVFVQQMLGLSRYQSESGLWHQILDKTDSYLETSCTAMFTYAIAKAVNEGWIDKRYHTIALNGWKGLRGKINEKGEIIGVCIGTGIRDDLPFYYTRPTPHNDFHGTGAVLLAGVEMLKLKKQMEKQSGD